MMNDREKAVERVKSLWARASDEASSEAEVSAAAHRAAKLIAEHELTDRDLLSSGDSLISQARHNEGRATQHPAMKNVCFAISKLTETTIIWRGGEVEAVGLDQDIEFAMYLCELIQGAADRAWKGYLRETRRKSTNRVRTSYMDSFGHGVRHTLNYLIAERDSRRAAQTVSTGTDIVVLKEAAIEKHLSETRGEIGTYRSRKKP